MALWIQRSEDGFIRSAIWNVINTLATLILHNVALEIHFRQIHGWQQESHAIGIEPQRER